MQFTRRHFVVIAEFTLRPGQLDAFLVLAHADASASLSNEPGCFACDVLVTGTETTYVMMHEIYRNREAFDLHRNTRHYCIFETDAKPLLDGDPFVRFFTTSVPD